MEVSALNARWDSFKRAVFIQNKKPWAIQSSDFNLFTPGPGVQLYHWRSDEGKTTGYLAPNSHRGVVVDYLLKSKIKVTKKEKADHETPVKIVVTDAKGNEVATMYGPSKAGVSGTSGRRKDPGAGRVEAAFG